ncbi:MAG: hypothetical protein MEQ07_05460 [Aquimonas sp.]|nr:hypothetical protein [Aquimonas sp.]
MSLPSAAATIVVNSGADVEGPPWVGEPARCAAGSTLPCRMRDAVAAARGGDRIVFAPGITEIALGRTLKFADTSGLPVTVDGEGRVTFPSPTGNPTLRMMGPHTNVVVLRGLTIQGGLADYGLPLAAPYVHDCGGAILNQGNLTLERITLTRGLARYGGLICNMGELRIADSTLTSGSAIASAGAIMNAGTLEVTNSTFDANFGPPLGFRFGHAGAVNNHYGTADFNFVTMARNRGAVDTENVNVGHAILNDCGDVRVRNSVLQASQVMGLSVGRYPCTIAPTRVENSLFPRSSAGLLYSMEIYWDDGGGNINAPAPLEEPAANGGPTPTMALPQDSLAIDAVPCVGAPATDQRGRRRPQGAACDMGAFEYTGELFVDGFEPGAATATGDQP